MKKSVFFPFVVITVIIILVSAACSFSTKKGDAETKEPEVVVVTATPKADEPVKTKEPVIEETEEPTAEGPLRYYREEFNGSIENFPYEVTYFSGAGTPDDVSVYAEDGAMKIENRKDYLWTYVYYDPYTYTDVRIDMEAENLATGNNSITLLCRYDPELGWYEYNVNSDGIWTLFYYDNVIAKDYIQLYDGGSTNINMGRDTNTYTMICKGKELSLYINDVFTHSFEHKDLKEGKIGFSVYSYYSYPVLVDINWLEISEP